MDEKEFGLFGGSFVLEAERHNYLLLKKFVAAVTSRMQNDFLAFYRNRKHLGLEFVEELSKEPIGMVNSAVINVIDEFDEYGIISLNKEMVIKTFFDPDTLHVTQAVKELRELWASFMSATGVPFSRLSGMTVQDIFDDLKEAYQQSDPQFYRERKSELDSIIKRIVAALENKNLPQIISNALANDISRIFEAIFEIQKAADVDNIAFITTADTDKAENLFRQVQNGSIPEDEKLAAFIEILELDPFTEKYYHSMIDAFGDENNEIEEIANFFSVDVVSYKIKLISEHFNRLPLSTIEEIRFALADASEFYNSLGGQNDKIDKAIHGDMEQKVHKAKVAIAKNFLTSLPKATEEEALVAKEKLVAYCKEIGLEEKNPAIQSINDVLRKMDLDIRTVEGIEFETREEAHKAREENSAIKEIIGSGGQIFRGDFLYILSEINSGRFTTDIKKMYEMQYTALLKEFDKKLEKAKHYEYKKNSGKKFTGFKNILKDVASALGSKDEQNAWDELTQNGKYALELVGSDSKSSNASLT